MGGRFLLFKIFLALGVFQIVSYVFTCTSLLVFIRGFFLIMTDSWIAIQTTNRLKASNAANDDSYFIDLMRRVWTSPREQPD